jgi:hypothetical protein
MSIDQLDEYLAVRCTAPQEELGPVSA